MTRCVSALGLLLLASLTGCLTLEKPEYQAYNPGPVNALVLGETNAAEVLRQFGVADAERIIENRVGNFRLLDYGYAEQTLWEGYASAHLMRIELVDGTLNGYVVFALVGSSPPPELSQIDRLRRGVTTQTEVRALLGEPSGRALAPTAMREIFEAYDYDENWLYLSDRFETDMAVRTEVRLGFNREGVLQDFGRVTYKVRQ